MYCPECSKNISDQSTYCSECGCDLRKYDLGLKKEEPKIEDPKKEESGEKIETTKSINTENDDLDIYHEPDPHKNNIMTNNWMRFRIVFMFWTAIYIVAQTFLYPHEILMNPGYKKLLAQIIGGVLSCALIFLLFLILAYIAKWSGWKKARESKSYMYNATLNVCIVIHLFSYCSNYYSYRNEQKKLQEAQKAEMDRFGEMSYQEFVELYDKAGNLKDLPTDVLGQGAGIEWEKLNQEVVDLYRAGNYDHAVLVAKRALEMAEKNVGPDHPDVALSLNNLTRLYHDQGKYVQAEPLYKRALAIREKALGANHPSIAESLNNLAELYRSQGKYALAEPLYKRSLAIWEKVHGPDHPDVATSLNNLALLYMVQGKYALAEPLFKRALTIKE